MEGIFVFELVLAKFKQSWPKRMPRRNWLVLPPPKGNSPSGVKMMLMQFGSKHRQSAVAFLLRHYVRSM